MVAGRFRPTALLTDEQPLNQFRAPTAHRAGIGARFGPAISARGTARGVPARGRKRHARAIATRRSLRWFLWWGTTTRYRWQPRQREGVLVLRPVRIG